MAWIPHNHFEPAKEVVHPRPDPHQDEAAALGARRSPAAAFVGMALALAGLALTDRRIGLTRSREALRRERGARRPSAVRWLWQA